jgi:rod shape-determining protein MreC
VFIILSIALMTLDHRYDQMKNVRAALSIFIYPIQKLMNLPLETGQWLSENLASRQQLLEENRSLHTQHLFLQSQLQKLDALEVENMRLRELLDSSFKVSEQVLIAELLAVDLKPFSQQITLNKGSKDNVYVGQPILNAKGAMGQVVYVGPLTSTAMLITDPNHALPVEINSNGIRGIAVGTGEPNRLELPFIPNNADVKVGDLLVTSGLGGHFPPSYPAGRIISVIPDPSQPFAEVYAEPTANLESTREVLLVWRTSDQKAANANEPESE